MKHSIMLLTSVCHYRYVLKVLLESKLPHIPYNLTCYLLRCKRRHIALQNMAFCFLKGHVLQ